MKRILSFAAIWIFIILFVDSGQQASLTTQSPAARPQGNESPRQVSRELEKIFNEDQSDSRPYNTPEERKETDERARRRIDQVSEIMRKFPLQSADDYYHAAMVFQHGSKPEDYLTAHALATVAGFKGHSWGRWLSAASLDLFLLSVGRHQVLGTIYGKDNFQRYDRYLSDSVRRQYCVPPMETQIRNQEFIEKRVGQFQRRARECDR
ncbi:MAG: hypothetical protein AB1631_05765 [Acidobacteriota bacterium]